MKFQTGLYVLNEECSGCGVKQPILWAPTTLAPSLFYCKECLAEAVDLIEQNERLFSDASKV